MNAFTRELRSLVMEWTADTDINDMLMNVSPEVMKSDLDAIHAYMEAALKVENVLTEVRSDDAILLEERLVVEDQPPETMLADPCELPISTYIQKVATFDATAFIPMPKLEDTIIEHEWVLKRYINDQREKINRVCIDLLLLIGIAPMSVPLMRMVRHSNHASAYDIRDIWRSEVRRRSVRSVHGPPSSDHGI
jgi:hypothetical protein